MTIRLRRSALAAAPALLLAAACSPAPQTSQQRADQAVIAACRQRAEEVYQRQNRAQLYQSGNSVTPYSAAPTTGLPTQGLSTLYAHDQLVEDCIRNTGTQTQRGAGSAGPAESPQPAPEPGQATP